MAAVERYDCIRPLLTPAHQLARSRPLRLVLRRIPTAHAPRPCRSYSSLLQTMATPESALKPAQAFVEFVNASPTPFHAVHESVVRLERAGFTRSVQLEASLYAAQPILLC